MKLLFIGGNGNISWHCVNEAINAGHTVYVLNREITLNTRREIQKNVIKLKGDIRNTIEMRNILDSHFFDVVCDFVCYDGVHAKNAVDLFNQKTNQYVYISSAAIYERKTKFIPFKEDCAKINPDIAFPYIKGKIEAEQIFVKSYEECAFPVTIVRPSYTYDTIVPVSLGHNCFTPIDRFLRNKPVLIAGEGNALWNFTHSKDFARAFLCLLGNASTIGEDYHITTDEWLTWNDATDFLLNAIGIKNPQILHVPLDSLLQTPLAAQMDLFTQKIWHNIYDNTKIKKIAYDWHAEIPFEQGIKSTINWLFEKDSYRRFDPVLDATLESITLDTLSKN